MGTTFYPGTYAANDPVMVERHGLPPVALSFVEELGDEYDVHMHVGGAAASLAALGYPTEDGDGCGHATPDEFLGRVLTAIALAPKDEGMPAYDANANGPGASFWHCARQPGDLQRRLGDLRGLAEFCKAEGYLVVWA